MAKTTQSQQQAADAPETVEVQQAADAPETVEVQQAADAPETVEVRVLVACAYGLPNDVVSVPATAVDDGVRANQIDPHPDAVAYAKTLK